MINYVGVSTLMGSFERLFNVFLTTAKAKTKTVKKQPKDENSDPLKENRYFVNSMCILKKKF